MRLKSTLSHAKSVNSQATTIPLYPTKSIAKEDRGHGRSLMISVITEILNEVNVGGVPNEEES